MMVSEIEPQHAERKTHLRGNKDSRAYAAIPGRTKIGPVIQVYIVQFLGSYGLEIQIPSPTNPERKSWLELCRGRNRFVDELHHRNPGHNLANSELHSERTVAKESEPCATELEQSRIEETHATQFKIPTDPVHHAKEVISIRENNWKDIAASQSFDGDSLQAEISKLVMKMLRRYDQDEKEPDGAIRWNSMGPKLLKAFQKWTKIFGQGLASTHL